MNLGHLFMHGVHHFHEDCTAASSLCALLTIWAWYGLGPLSCLSQISQYN